MHNIVENVHWCFVATWTTWEYKFFLSSFVHAFRYYVNFVGEVRQQVAGDFGVREKSQVSLAYVFR